MTTVKRPILRYHGGKWLQAPWTISHFPPHLHYAELLGGGGSSLIRKPRSKYETYNDLWGTVVNVFRVLQNKEMAAELERLVRLTPFAREEFMLCGEAEIAGISDPIEKARLTVFRSFAGYGSAATNNKHATGFRTWPRPKGSSPAQDWANWPDQIKHFTERLQGVTIENRHYADLIPLYDGPDTLFYLDPPYPHDTRNMRRGNSAYAHEFTDQDHIDMAAHCRNLRSMVVISGYDCPLYQDLFGTWHKVQKAALADGGRPRIECLWLNDNAVRRGNKRLL